MDAQQVNNIGASEDLPCTVLTPKAGFALHSFNAGGRLQASEVLPHLKPKADIDKLYPQMVAPPEYGDHDFEVVSQAELWVVHD